MGYFNRQYQILENLRRAVGKSVMWAHHRVPSLGVRVTTPDASSFFPISNPLLPPVHILCKINVAVITDHFYSQIILRRIETYVVPKFHEAFRVIWSWVSLAVVTTVAFFF